MAFEGMDPDQVEQYGRQLDAEARNIENLIRTISSHVSTVATNWQGKDSDDFQHEWSTTYLKQMTQAQYALQTLSQAAIRNAGDQRNTSSHL